MADFKRDVRLQGAIFAHDEANADFMIISRDDRLSMAEAFLKDHGIDIAKRKSENFIFTDGCGDRIFGRLHSFPVPTELGLEIMAREAKNELPELKLVEKKGRDALAITESIIAPKSSQRGTLNR